MQANNHEEFGGYCKRHIRLHTILREFEDSGCWRIMLASLRELDTILDMCSLTNLHHDTLLTLRHGFYPHTHVDVQPLEVSLLENEEICEEFDMDDHYVGHVNNRSPPSFHIVVDCHEGYMFI